MSYPYIFDLIFGSEKALYYNSLINSFKKYKPIPPDPPKPIILFSIGGVIDVDSSSSIEEEVSIPSQHYYNKLLIQSITPSSGVVIEYNS